MKKYIILIVIILIIVIIISIDLFNFREYECCPDNGISYSAPCNCSIIKKISVELQKNK